MTPDILCPVCKHSINLHYARNCYKRKNPGSYCKCRQTAVDIAQYEIAKVRAELEALRLDIQDEREEEREI